jgi:hypothetical protein
MSGSFSKNTAGILMSVKYISSSLVFYSFEISLLHQPTLCKGKDGNRTTLQILPNEITVDIIVLIRFLYFDSSFDLSIPILTLFDILRSFLRLFEIVSRALIPIFLFKPCALSQVGFVCNLRKILSVQ